jgi:hypothetical protein
MVSIGPQEMINRHPPCGVDLGIESNCGARAQQEHEGPNRDRWQDRGARHHVLEGPSQISRAELDAHFLKRLPERGGQEVRVFGLPAAARQGHVAGPGVSGPFGPSNQENGVWIGSKDDGDGGPDQRSIVVGAGSVGGQALAQASEPAAQCECDWQPPPQQPPPGGGPSRL